jgi:hypothetical protein
VIRRSGPGGHHDRAVGDGCLPVRGPCWCRPLAARAPRRGAGSPAAGAPATVEDPANSGGRAGPLTSNAIELGGGSVEPGPPAGWPGPANHLTRQMLRSRDRAMVPSSSRPRHPLCPQRGVGPQSGRGRNRAATPRSRPAPPPPGAEHGSRREEPTAESTLGNRSGRPRFRQADAMPGRLPCLE